MYMFFIGLSLDDVGIILADVKDNESLKEMAAKSSVVINCVGPVGLIFYVWVWMFMENFVTCKSDVKFFNVFHSVNVVS